MRKGRLRLPSDLSTFGICVSLFRVHGLRRTSGSGFRDVKAGLGLSIWAQEIMFREQGLGSIRV